MHQDAPYFLHENHTMTAASVHLDDADMENGCLCVIPGSDPNRSNRNRRNILFQYRDSNFHV
jgi:ectoine hydroxylase-related dioxygenase (phytanoyl-CoA dioxygenase family)